MTPASGISSSFLEQPKLYPSKPFSWQPGFSLELWHSTVSDPQTFSCLCLPITEFSLPLHVKGLLYLLLDLIFFLQPFILFLSALSISVCWVNEMLWCSGCLTDWNWAESVHHVSYLWHSSEFHPELDLPWFFSPGVSQFLLIFTQQTAVAAGPFLMDCCLFTFSFCNCVSDVSFNVVLCVCLHWISSLTSNVSRSIRFLILSSLVCLTLCHHKCLKCICVLSPKSFMNTLNQIGSRTIQCTILLESFPCW